LEANLVVDESKKSKDILKAVLNVATPVIISNLLYTVETLVSLLLVSHLGKSAIAGVGYSISMMWFVYSLMALTYNGTSIMVSHRVGAGKPFFDVFLSGMVLSLLLSIPITLFGTKFIPELMLLFGAKKDIANIATIYLKPIF
jgi:Na+-driven multidrug efflux pump